MNNLSCQEIAQLLSGKAAGHLSESEVQSLESHLAQCPSCSAWATQHDALVQHIKTRPAILAPHKFAAMRSTFMKAPLSYRPVFSEPYVLGVIALAASIALVLWLAPLSKDQDGTTSTLGKFGPHQGLVLEKDGSRVELVTTPEREVRVYLSDTKGTPHLASRDVKMLVSADAFAPTETALKPAPDGSYLVGKLPESGAKSIKLVFPSGAEFAFEDVSVPASTSPSHVIAPPVEVNTPGGVAVVDKNRIVAEVLPKGEVRVQVLGDDAKALAPSDYAVPEITIAHQNKKYPVKLKAKDGYWGGVIASPAEISAGSQVDVVCTAPLMIRGVTYEPTVVVFTHYTVKVGVKIVAPVIIKYEYPHGHKYKGSHKGSHKNKSHKRSHK